MTADLVAELIATRVPARRAHVVGLSWGGGLAHTLVARYAPGLAHGWIARDTDLHVRMVRAWLTGQELPSELRPETPSPAAVERLLRELGEPARVGDGPALPSR